MFCIIFPAKQIDQLHTSSSSTAKEKQKERGIFSNKNGIIMEMEAPTMTNGNDSPAKGGDFDKRRFNLA